MKSSRRVIACALVAVVVLLGPLPLTALAQQPAQPPVVDEMSPPEGRMVQSFDAYDVGAGVFTVAKAPFNVALCGLGTATATVLFLLTFGSAYRASTRVIEEGCAQRWVIHGDDLRPRGAPGIFQDRSSEMYNRR